MIIGLVGFIGSGKGTVGNILSDYGYIRESFAGSLKDVASVMFDWPRKLLEGDTDESRTFRETPDVFWSEHFGRSFTPRDALQKLGTESVRNVFHENFWIVALDRKIKNNNNYVITDVRFQNEIQYIRNKGGKIIEVQRGEKPDWYDIAISANMDNLISRHLKSNEYMSSIGIHPSEWKWIGCKPEYVLKNDGNLDDLTRNVIDILKPV